MRRLLGAPRGVVVAALVLTLVVVVGVAVWALTPRTTGLSGDWSAAALDGEVVAGRVLVGGGNAALDLRTGRSVRLGSVVGGTASYADDRLVVVSGSRVDSVRLDASARWTWQAPAGHRVVPLAAGGGSTLVADCPAALTDRCRLVGIDATGRPGWATTGVERPAAPASSALPRVHASRVSGGGLLLTDPESGRTSLQPGSSFVAVPDGPVVVPVQQDGQCVVSAFTGPDPLWTRVLGPCPGGALPDVHAGATSVDLAWPGRTDHLATGTGATLSPAARAAAEPPTTARRTAAVWADPLRWGGEDHVLELLAPRTREVRARLVTERPATVLLLEPRAVVVREGDRVVRYTVGD